LRELHQATLKWLEHENPSPFKANPRHLLHLALDVDAEETPEQPEALTVLRESKRLLAPPLPGALSDYPYIARLEFAAVANAEYEFKQRMELYAKFLARQQGGTNANSVQSQKPKFQ
jgi:hypothetical protein